MYTLKIYDLKETYMPIYISPIYLKVNTKVASLIKSETMYDNTKILKYLLEHLNKITKNERCKMDANYSSFIL